MLKRICLFGLTLGVLIIIMVCYIQFNIHSNNHKSVDVTSDTQSAETENISLYSYTENDVSRSSEIRDDIDLRISKYIELNNPYISKEKIDDIKMLILRNSNEYGFDPLLISAVTCVESHFQDDLVSDAGAVGIMQIMPSTARYVAEQIGISNYSLENYADNITIGVRCLYIYVNSWENIEQIDNRNGKTFDKIQMGLLSYNGGTNNARELSNLEYLYSVEDEYYNIKHMDLN